MDILLGNAFFQRFSNYSVEMISIRKKLERNALPKGKKSKLLFRLSDLQNRLLPETVKRIYSSLTN